MGNPAYDARREAERAEAERDRACAEAGQAAYEAVTEFLSGNASFVLTPMIGGTGLGPTAWQLRLMRKAP